MNGVWLAMAFNFTWIGIVILAIVCNLSYPKKVDLIRRADQQHQWTMTGDPRGTYGDFMPEDLWGQGDVVDH